MIKDTFLLKCWTEFSKIVIREIYMHTFQDNIKKNGSPYLLFLFKSLACFYMAYLDVYLNLNEVRNK